MKQVWEYTVFEPPHTLNSTGMFVLVHRHRKAFNHVHYFVDSRVRLSAPLADRWLQAAQDHPFISISRSSRFDGCKFGKYPAPVKFGLRTTAWRAEDIGRLIEGIRAAND